MSGVLRYLSRAALLYQADQLSDGQLLERFLARRDEAAFEALVKRHGSMVLGVCRRVLHNPHDTEDAFQATFLVLIRKAATIVPRDDVGNWLYGVAYRTALEARTAAARRRAKERRVTRMPRPEVSDEEVWTDLRDLLDQELSRLPDKYRAPIVLCDLEGKTRKAAARQLGWREGTLSWRLARARRLLADHLTRRGVALSGGALALTLARNAAGASVPVPLVARTVTAATTVVRPIIAAGVISAQVLALTEGVLKTMLLAKLKVATAVLLLIASIGAGAAGYVYHVQAAEGSNRGPEGEPVARISPSVEDPPKQSAEADRLRKAVEDVVKQLTKALDETAVKEHAARAYKQALQDHRSYLADQCTLCHKVDPHLPEDDHHRHLASPPFHGLYTKEESAKTAEAALSDIEKAMKILRTSKHGPEAQLQALTDIENAVKKLKQVVGKK
jgi:RNA polymerase sigma factor (sigma-70 family)